MAQDPRSFMSIPCVGKQVNKNLARIANAGSTRGAFFNALGKVGNLEILNGSQGTSAAGLALRTLASTSNAIRTGQNGGLPTAIGDNLDLGANFVLNSMGVSEAQMQALSQFNPSLANSAYGNAKQIYQLVSQGGFSLDHIPSYLQEFQNVEQLTRGIFYPNRDQGTQLRQVCDPSQYAIDLVSLAPKFKFLFVVQFIYNTDYAQFSDLDFAFVVKRSTRPDVNYMFEDVNYYNFRSKVATRSEFMPMQMVFHDDNKNQALRFYNAYMRSLTPISNLSTGGMLWDQQGLAFENSAFDAPGTTSYPGESAGNVTSGIIADSAQNPLNIEFTIPANEYAASIGPLRGTNTRTIMNEIRLYHIFNYGLELNVYHFYNPRIDRLSLDELSMEDSSGSEVQISFNYDNLHIETDIPFQDYNLEQLTSRSGMYPLHYNGFGTQATNDAYATKPPAVIQPVSAGQTGSGNDIVDNIKGFFETTPSLSVIADL